MHKQLLPLLFILASTILTAQNICENFDGFTVTTANKQHAFNTYGNGNSGFLQNWSVTSGTPAIYANGDFNGINANSNTQCALMAVCDVATDWSEGIALNYNFQQGKTYQVSLAIRNAPLSTSPTPLDINFQLLKNAISFTYQTQTGCTQTPSVPGTSLNVHTISGFATNAWQTVNFTISNLTDSYSQLWFRSGFSSGAPLSTTFLLMDDVCVNEVIAEATCYQFDDTTLTNATTRQHAFDYFGNGNAGFLQDWLVASGTPAIFSTGELNGTPAYTGTQSALMAVCDAGANWNESLELTHDFTQGGNYTVSFALRNAQALGASAVNIDFLLLNAPISFTYQTQTGCTQVAAIPSSAFNAYSITNLTTNSWGTYSFNVTGLTSTYTHLWIRPRFASGNVQTTTFVLLDSLCISQTSTVGIPELKHELNAVLYPNPAIDGFHIALSNNQTLQSVRLYNYAGAMVKDWQNLFSPSAELNVSTLNNGVYLAEITDTKGSRTTKKLVISR